MLGLRLKVSARALSNSTKLTAEVGIWNNYSIRPSSLKLINQKKQDDSLNSIKPGEGLESMKGQEINSAYNSPIAINETFKDAYEILQNKSKKIYNKINKIEKTKNTEKIDKLLIKAEQFNPEVLYNQTFHSDKLDVSQPVYRDYLRKQWESYDLMITMQRLESLHVIPDTLPTLVPKVDVKIKFPHNITHPEFQSWITPGTILPSFAVSQPPTIKITDFDNINNEDQLYTILVVNPDTPDLSKNSFKTVLHYALSNVSLNNVDNTITTEKLLNMEHNWLINDYTPLTPEKNVPTQRACMWVFKQQDKILADIIDKENFNIRKFTNKFNLTPIGAHVWRQKFDRSVNEVRESYGIPKGKVFHRVRRDVPLGN